MLGRVDEGGDAWVPDCYFWALVLRTMVVRMATSWVDSLVRSVRREAGRTSVAASRRSQYWVSRASLQAIEILLRKSARLWPAWASSVLAPMEVPALSN